ncbi:hypothetical protein [Caulobacter mirabilis]|uniref:ASCH domain-containing protein n=1 Tax=Caulobacter mirabilis TaxID=69666 RepID=A0A2D2B2K8_9CAUL|nr:hypothetical protein [Caulobacter mirabilis]ATQ44474.1 hypothetical protein CSW64_19830 [Caulobacter mirabilis]
MLFKQATLDAIAEGRVDLAFRRWRRPTVKAGGTLTTPVGVLTIDAVAPVDVSAIAEADAARAGFPTLAALHRELDGREGDLFRIAFHRSGVDPRIALRDAVPLDATIVLAKLADMDRRHGAPWTLITLRLIAERPGVRAGDLAAALGEPELLAFKTRVRRLKALGLTESLEVGYRLSPRGAATLALAPPPTPP